MVRKGSSVQLRLWARAFVKGDLDGTDSDIRV